MDLGTPGNIRTDLLGRAKENGEETRHEVRLDLGYLDEMAAEVFAINVLVSDGFLQMVMCYRVVGSPKEIIPGKDSEAALKDLAKRI